MHDHIEQLKAIMEQKLAIVTEIEDIMHYMEYALDNDDLDLLERSIEDRALAIDDYNHLEEKYQDLAKNLDDKTVLEELSQPIYDILKNVQQRDKDIVNQVEQLYEKSKSDMKAQSQSRKATNGYLGAIGAQGRLYDTKK